MAQYGFEINPITGQLQLINDAGLVTFKAAVANQAALPLTGNAKNDTRIATDTGHMYIWSIEASAGLLTDWSDQGDVIDVSWASLTGKPTSTPEDIDNAVSIRHTAVTAGVGIGLIGQQVSNSDTGSAAVTAHNLAFVHGDIAHTNRAALDNVSGTNTGDQDLSGYSTIAHNHDLVYLKLIGGTLTGITNVSFDQGLLGASGLFVESTNLNDFGHSFIGLKTANSLANTATGIRMQRGAENPWEFGIGCGAIGNKISILNNANVVFTLQTNGRLGLGIGNTSPAEILDILGNIKVSGSLTDGTKSKTVANIADHIDSTSNPHGVTATQVGLGNVPNTDCTNPANIVQDATHRFVTDAEKSTWNGAASANYDGTFTNANVDTYRKLLLLFAGNDGDKAYTAESGQVVSFFGDAQLDNAQYVFNTSSLLLDGTGDYISMVDSDDFYFDGNFTIKVRVRFNALPSSGSDMVFVGQRNSATSYWYFRQFNNAGSQSLTFDWYNAAGNSVTVGFTPSTGVWYNIEINKSGNDYYFFVDGVQQGTTQTSATSILNVSADLIIGQFNSGAYLNGWIGELVIDKGVARHIAAFTARTSPESYKFVTVTHSLTKDYPIVMVYDADRQVYMPDNIRSVSNSVIELDLSSFGTLIGTHRVRVF
jgi:hypothetical protein